MIDDGAGALTPPQQRRQVGGRDQPGVDHEEVPLQARREGGQVQAEPDETGVLFVERGEGHRVTPSAGPSATRGAASPRRRRSAPARPRRPTIR